MKLNDTRLRFLGPVGLYVFISFFFRLDYYLNLPLHAFVRNISIALSAGIICWQIARWTVLQVQRRYPGLANTRKRLLWLLALLPLLVGIAWMMRHVIRFLITGTFTYFVDPIELGRNIGIQIFYHFIYYAIYEGWYILRQWQQETIEVNTSEKVSLQNQLFSLKQQVNPHFLFNSLNSLSSLIGEDPDKADAFLEELTAVFRYLLQASEQRLVPLREEVDFIRSYGHLLQTRYPSGLVVDLSVEATQECLLIPPLTLKVLVDNAVRYNLILPEQPLHVRIESTADNRLQVANTLQRKTLRVDTGGGGLSNLSSQYMLLSQSQLMIREQPGWFVVSLPLIGEGRLTEGSAS